MLKLFATAAFALSIALAAGSARAASPMTEAFLGNVAANVTILDTSSRLAASHTASAALKTFAASETAETRQVALALTDALPTDHHTAAAPEPAMKTGRSVAIAGLGERTGVAPNAPVLEAANGRMPATADLAKLGTLRGKAFDDAYFVLQLDALSQIESDYRTYIAEGDDPALVKMAHDQLPGVMRRLEALTGV